MFSHFIGLGFYLEGEEGKNGTKMERKWVSDENSCLETFKAVE